MARRRKGKLVLSSALLLVGVSLLGVAAMIARKPRDAQSSVHRALSLLSEGDVEGSLAAFDRAIEQTSTDGERERARKFELLTRRGDLNLRLRRPNAALNDFQLARQLHPGDAFAWELEGKALLALEKFEAAAKLFEEARLAFPDRERYFRYASGCAGFSSAQARLAKAQALLEQRIQPGRTADFRQALERFSSTAPRPLSRAEIEENFLKPPHGTADRDDAFEQVAEAKSAFLRADEQLSDFETSPDQDPSFGRIRMEMHLRAGRYYELRRTAEVLLRLPAKDPQQLDDQLRIRNTLANGFHELQLASAAAGAFAQLRKGYYDRAQDGHAHGDEESSRRDFEMARRCAFASIEERMRARQGQEATQMLVSLGSPQPNNVLSQFTFGFARYLAGDRGECLGNLTEAANHLVKSGGRSSQFRDAEHRGFVLDSLVEALAGIGKPELAASIASLALREARDPVRLLRTRIELLRPLRAHLAEVVDDEFELLKLDRDHGDNLARWENDWALLQGQPAKVEQAIAEHAERLLRVYKSFVVSDTTFAKLVKSASMRRARYARSSGSALETSAKALLRDLEGDPCLVLQVYRALLGGGNRDQAFLLLFGLASAEPDVADFRLLLVQHDLAEGRLDDASQELDRLIEQLPDDVDLLRLAYSVARRRGDDAAMRAIVERSLGDAPGEAGRVLAAEFALDRGRPEVALAACRGAERSTPHGCALLGLAARAELELGRVAEAEQVAAVVLEQEPAERSALRAVLEGLARRATDPKEGVRSPCDLYLADHTAPVAQLDGGDAAELARAIFVAGDFAAAATLLELVQERATRDPDSGLLLADVLFALDRYDEVEQLLSTPLFAASGLEVTRRMTLNRLARDGVEAAWQYLHERVATGDPEPELARWLGLLGAASGRSQAAVDVLARRKVELDESSQRFLALALLAQDSKVPEKSLPAGVAARMRLGETSDPARDRELERWLSLDLASPKHEFLASLLRLFLLSDLPSLASLRRSEERRLLARYPSLGFLTRERAVELDAAGDTAAAASLLARQIEQDPDDLESLRLIALFAAELDQPTRERICALAQRSALAPGWKSLLQAWTEFAAGHTSEGVARLNEAAQSEEARAAALVARAHAPTRRRLFEADLGRAPWCEAAARARQIDVVQDVDRTVVQAASGAGSDPVVLRHAARRLHDEGARMDEEPRRRLITALVSQPGPWFEAHALAISEAARTGADRETLDALGANLEAAIAAWKQGPLPADAMHGVAELAELARRDKAPEQAWRLIELAYRSCALDPAILAVHGRLALDRGDLTLALKLFRRARLFGCEDPEVLVWVGEYELDARGEPAEAKELGDAAVALSKAPTDAPLRARAYELIARSSYLLGDEEKSRVAWVEAFHQRGEDTRLCLAVGLEGFARMPPEVAIERLAMLAATEGPARALAERLTAQCRKWQSEANPPPK